MTTSSITEAGIYTVSSKYLSSTLYIQQTGFIKYEQEVV